MLQQLSTLIPSLLLVCTVTCVDTDQPLHLSPYLRRGEIDTARNLSAVSYRNDSLASSYAGFITVDPILGNHLFFWFFPAFNSDPKSPVVVWLNGGPGVPSMLGLFHENGPLRLQSQGDGGFSLKIWNLTWADQFSMLYIDNPVGAGYSYTESGEKGYRTTQDGYTNDLYEFIQQFYIMFPEYLKRDLYIGGQSYAGKFVTSLAHRIHMDIVGNKSAVPLTGIYLGAPFLDPFPQSRAMGNFFYSTGAISQRQLRDHQSLVEDIFRSFRSRQMTADEAVGAILLNSTITRLWTDNYSTGSSAPYDELWYMMNMLVMRELVHAGNATFRVGDDDFRARYNHDRLQGVRSELAALLDSYKVLIYNGDLDAVVTSAMVDAALVLTSWSLKAQYDESVREVWSDGLDLKGFFTRTGRFCRVVIHGAGHQAPYDQPEVSLDMMTQFIKYGCIQNQTV